MIEFRCRLVFEKKWVKMVSFICVLYQKGIKSFEIFIGPFQIGSHSGWGDPGYGRLNKAYF